jgi:hypothetical protein
MDLPVARYCPNCKQSLQTGLYHCLQCGRSPIPRDVLHFFMRASAAASLGIEPGQLRTEEYPDGTMAIFFEIPDGVVLDDRQRRAAQSGARLSGFEPIVASAIGWEAEVSVPVRAVGRQPRRLDVADVAHKVNIELDGIEHGWSEQFELDRLYDEALRAAGWTVLRFPNVEAQEELDSLCRAGHAAAGTAWQRPVSGETEGALSYASSADLEDLLHRLLSSFTAPFIVQPRPNGLIFLWIELGARVVPFGWLNVPSANFSFTRISTRLSGAGRAPLPAMVNALRDLGLYEAMAGGVLQVRRDFEPKIEGVIAALETHLTDPAIQFARLSPIAQIGTLVKRASERIQVEAIDTLIEGDGLLVSAALRPGRSATVLAEGLLRGLRMKFLRTSLTEVDHLKVRISAGDKVLCEVTSDRETIRRAARARPERLLIWSGFVGEEMSQPIDAVPDF